MKKTLLVLTLTLLTLFTQARKFYFSSSTGSDSRTSTQAQNINTPWQTLQKLQQQVVGGVNTFTAGDTIAFKRGDVFANGYTRYSTPNYYDYASCSWINDPINQWTAPSGTAVAPIVFTNYGDPSLPLPNFYYPLAETPITKNSYNVFDFEGVSWIVIDGLQFNDTRFPYADKFNPAYTRSSIILGVWTQSTPTKRGSNDPANRAKMVNNVVVKNCYFANTSFALGQIACDVCDITNNVVENLKASVDTTGYTDIGAGSFEAMNGFHINISHNYIKGIWAGSGRVSDCWGLLGVAFDMFNVKNSKFTYNTIVDCSGAFEIGNTDQYDFENGSWYDTFAYNKIINCGQIGYIHGQPGDVFAGNNRNIAVFNNVYINNNKSRIDGPQFGGDLYGDGQSFRGDRNGNYKWWFFRSPTLCPNDFQTTGDVTNGSQTVVMSTLDIQINSRLYDYDETGGYKTVTGIGSGQVTVSVPFAVTQTGYKFHVYPPISDPNWSQPINHPYCNYNGHRTFVAYSSDDIKGNADTLVDSRNNIIYSTTGDQQIYDVTRTKQKHRNNVYYIKGAFRYPTVLGGTLNTTAGETEYQTTTKLFVDTSSAFPENWDLHLASGSLAIGKGVAIGGLTKDFAGVTLSGIPDIGLYKYSATPLLVLNSTTNVTCKTGNNGSFTISTSGGTAPYTYKVNNSLYTTTTTYSNLAPATYAVTVKDSKGLLSTINVTIKSSSVTCP